MFDSHKELTEQFTALDQQNNIYTVLRYTNFIEIQDQEIRGLHEYFLEDGTRLNAEGDGIFSTVTRPPITLRRSE